ncbi:MAG: hypothetical protein FD123_3849 [Bacteroidetes bacterium]|nr:MAG: hypothetical protein FD123_3849 [Bacteroidota bacterium]
MKNLLALFLFIFPAFTFAQPAYIHHEKGVQKLKNKQYAESILDFDKAIKADATYFEAYIDRGRANVALNKNDLAMADFSKAVQLNPKYAPGFFERAKVYSALGKDKEAIEDYTKITQVQPDFSDTYVYRGQLYFKTGQNDLALADFNKAISLKAKNAEVFYQRGLLYLAMKKTNEAMKDLTAAIEIDPLMTRAFFERGKLYATQSRQHELAVADYSKAITLKHPGEEVYHLRAVSYTALRKNEEAIRDYSSVIEMFKSKDPEIYRSRGDLFRQRNDHVNAIKDYNRALSFKKDDAVILTSRGQSQFALGKGKYPMAQQDFNKALGIDPDNVNAAYGLGQIFFENNKFEESIASLDKAIKIKATADAYYLRSKCHHKLNHKKNVCEDLNKAAEMGHPEAKKDVITICGK